MNEAAIWGFLKSQGMTDAGVAGLMGNLFAESGLNPKNLQNSYEKKLGFTDATYTVAVDNGTYTNFVRDSAGRLDRLKVNTNVLTGRENLARLGCYTYFVVI